MRIENTATNKALACITQFRESVQRLRRRNASNPHRRCIRLLRRAVSAELNFIWLTFNYCGSNPRLLAGNRGLDRLSVALVGEVKSQSVASGTMRGKTSPFCHDWRNVWQNVDFLPHSANIVALGTHGTMCGILLMYLQVPCLRIIIVGG